MKHRFLDILKIAIVFFVCLIMIGLYSNLSESSVDVLSKRGSRGSEVTNIQTRLKRWGYYSGNIDGIYGRKTEEAVRYFQRKNGLVVDGIAGPKTLAKIGLPTKTSSSSSATSNEVALLARIISAEARGEPYLGQVAVGAVVLNRVEHPSFPDTISGVIYQPGAFTALTDGQFNVAVAESAKKAAREALAGSDPSGGAIYYYNPKTAKSSWIRSRPVIKQIGNHLFCK
ncbi:MAG: spore cortex-lytic enzyme [Oscillospiraceae bacterium]|nr:spore cortex-lytic enzyme [Oscillospiraceae bacterium]